jgi:hypothetical protein
MLNSEQITLLDNELKRMHSLLVMDTLTPDQWAFVMQQICRLHEAMTPVYMIPRESDLGIYTRPVY